MLSKISQTQKDNTAWSHLYVESKKIGIHGNREYTIRKNSYLFTHQRDQNKIKTLRPVKLAKDKAFPCMYIEKKMISHPPPFLLIEKR